MRSLVTVSMALIKHYESKQLGEKGVYFSLNVQITVYNEKRQGKNLKAGTDAEDMGECCLLA